MIETKLVDVEKLSTTNGVSCKRERTIILQKVDTQSMDVNSLKRTGSKTA